MRSVLPLSIALLLTACQQVGHSLARTNFQTNSEKNLNYIVGVYNRAFAGKVAPRGIIRRFGPGAGGIPSSPQGNFNTCQDAYHHLPITRNFGDYQVAMVTADRCMRNNMRYGNFLHTWGYQQQYGYGYNQRILSYLNNPVANYGYNQESEDDFNLYNTSMFSGF